jgi:hypothetical protein
MNSDKETERPQLTIVLVDLLRAAQNHEVWLEKLLVSPMIYGNGQMGKVVLNFWRTGTVHRGGVETSSLTCTKQSTKTRELQQKSAGCRSLKTKKLCEMGLAGKRTEFQKLNTTI